MSDEALRRLLPRVRGVAWRLSRRLPLHVDLEELVQAGMIGAWQALETYNPDAGALIETWVERRARFAMIEALRQADHLTRDERVAARARSQADTRLEQRLGRPPRRAELAAELGWSDEQMRATDRVPQAIAWEELCNVTGEPSKAPLAAVLEREQTARLEVELARLPPRARDVLRMLLDGELTQQEIGALFGLSAARVSQIAAETVALLAARLADPPTVVAATVAPVVFRSGSLVG